jgi:hypothetical protein
LAGDLQQLSALLLSLLESLGKLSDLLLIILFLGLEYEDGIILELLLGHLLESLDSLGDLVDVLHECLGHVISANGQCLPSNQLNVLVQRC